LTDRVDFKFVWDLVFNSLKDIPTIHLNPNWNLFCSVPEFYNQVWIDCGYAKISTRRIKNVNTFWKDVASHLKTVILGELPIKNHMITSFS